MVQTRRSFTSCSPSYLDRAKRQKGIASMNPTSPGVQTKINFNEVITRILKAIFLSAKRNYWYQILPSDGSFFDITDSTGLEWEDLLPLLVQAGLVTFSVSSVVKSAKIVHSQWDEMATLLASQSCRLEWTTVRPRDITGQRSRLEFFCMDTPVYQSPLAQIRLLNSDLSSMICTALVNRTQHQMASDIRAAGEKIWNRQLYNQLTHDNVIANNTANEGCP